MRNEIDEQIKELEKILNGFKQISKEHQQPKFKDGDVIKHINGAIVLITDFENGHGYGFDYYKKWSTEKWNFHTYKQDWKLATSEEWLEALTKEAVKFGFKENTVQTIDFKYLSNYIDTIHTGMFNYTDKHEFCIGGRIIMQYGIWAEVIKEETLEELADRFQKVWASSDNSIAQLLVPFFNENKETINRLSK